MKESTLLQYGQRKPSLSTEEVTRLFHEYRKGASEKERKRAYDELVLRNIPFVFYIARQFFHHHEMMLEDLVQEGITHGLLRAIEKFDPDRGVKFGTYAIFWVTQAMRRSLEERGYRFPVRFPANIQKHVVTIYQVQEELLQRLGRPAEVHEIVAYLQTMEGKKKNTRFDEKYVHDILSLRPTRMTISLNDSFDNDDESYGDRFVGASGGVDTYAIAKEELYICARELGRFFERVEKLPEREQIILRCRLGLGGPRETLQKISDKLGISREYVRFLQNKSLKKMKCSYAGVIALFDRFEQLRELVYTSHYAH